MPFFYLFLFKFIKQFFTYVRMYTNNFVTIPYVVKVDLVLRTIIIKHNEFVLDDILDRNLLNILITVCITDQKH